MARTSLGVGWIAVCSTSCLVTSSPDFEDPEQTPPVLIAESAVPDLRVIQVIDPTVQSVTFSAEVRSVEDLGENIRVRLYVDYGVEGPGGRPFPGSPRGGPEVLAGQTGGPRLATAEWFRGDGGAFVGCHTFTLIVSHQFDDETDCPERLADSSQLTWHAFICDQTGPCPPPVSDPRFECPVPTTECPEVAGDEAEGGGGASSTP